MPKVCEFEVISGANFPRQVIPLIDSAESCISIVVFDWRWYPNDPGASCQLFNQAIIRAVRRGVAVKAIINNDQILSILQSNGVSCRKLITTKLVHCKMMTIDNDVVVTGSHNYSQNAFTMNYELSTLLRGDNVAIDFIDFFNHLWCR